MNKKMIASQFEYRIINKNTGKKDSMCATARDMLAGWLAVNRYYGDTHQVIVNPIAVRAPHTVLGEINCL